MVFQKLDIEKVYVAKKKQEKSDKRLFVVIKDGTDVKINRPIRNEWEGFTFSQLAEDFEGRKLLRWICHTFDGDIAKIADYHLDE